MIRLGILASGNGSNAVNFINYFREDPNISVAKIYTNNPSAGVITKAFALNVPVHVFSRRQLKEGSVTDQLKQDQIDCVVLAGFLWLVPSNMIEAFPERIINIHPALLPSYGGKGMYGMRVHEAVVDNGEKESGITIHLVDEQYDHGDHLFQARTPVESNDSPEDVATKIHALEHKHFPEVVKDYLMGEGS